MESVRSGILIIKSMSALQLKRRKSSNFTLEPMATRGVTRKPTPRLDLARLWVLGASFDPHRTQTAEGDVEVLLNGHVNVSLPSGSSHRDALEEIGRSARPPFQISSLHELLNDLRFPRGNTYFGYVGGQIDQIVSSYGEQRLRWWMAKDGLVVDVVTPEPGPLSEFDRLPGPHKVLIELADPTHRVISSETVEFVVPKPVHPSSDGK